VHVAELLKHKTAGASADRRGNGDDCADEALNEIEAPGAGRHVGNHQHREHGDGGGADATQALADDKSGVARKEGEYQSAQSLDAEPDQQQRLAAEFLGMVSDPWRQDRGDDLRCNDEAGHQQRCGPIFAQRQILADHRKHRGIGKLKQENAAGENVKPQIFC